MIRPDRIGHVVITVRDIERSRKFYTEVMGLDLMMELPQLKAAFFATEDGHLLSSAFVDYPLLHPQEVAGDSGSRCERCRSGAQANPSGRPPSRRAAPSCPRRRSCTSYAR